MVPFVVSSLLGKYSILKKYVKGTRFHLTFFNPSIFFRLLQNFIFFILQYQKNRCSLYFFSFIKAFNLFFFNFFKHYANIYFSSVPYPGFLSNFNFLMLGGLKNFVNDTNSFLLGAAYSPIPQFSFNSSLFFLDFFKNSSFVTKELSCINGPSFGFSQQKSFCSSFFYSLITDSFFNTYSFFYLLMLKDLLITSSRFSKKKKVFWKKNLKQKPFLKIRFNWYRLFYLYSFLLVSKASDFFFLNNYSVYAKRKFFFYYSKKKKKTKNYFSTKKKNIFENG